MQEQELKPTDVRVGMLAKVKLVYIILLELVGFFQQKWLPNIGVETVGYFPDRHWDQNQDYLLLRQTISIRIQLAYNLCQFWCTNSINKSQVKDKGDFETRSDFVSWESVGQESGVLNWW